MTKLGRLVKAGKIKTIEHIYLFSMPIKEYEIVEYFLGEKGSGKLKDEVMKVQPVQKQTRAGQRTRFKAFVLVGDFDGHVGLGVKVGKEVANAIRAAIIDGKMNVVPARRGYWGNKIGLPHTVPNKIHGKCGSVHIRLVPAPRGTGIVAAPVSKKILQYAGVTDCFTQTKGTTMVGASVSAVAPLLQSAVFCQQFFLVPCDDNLVHVTPLSEAFNFAWATLSRHLLSEGTSCCNVYEARSR